MEGEGRRRPDPPLSVPLPLCKLPTAVTAPEPTHSTPSPRQNPASTRARPPCPASPVHVASTPCAGHPLGALVPAPLAYKKPPPIKRTNSPHSQLAPRQPLFSPLALVRRRQLRRRGTRRGRRRRVRPPWSKPTPGIGGGASPQPFPPVAVEPCFLYARRRRRRLPLCAQVSSLLAVEHDADAPLD
jgi:hypothetical protein